MITCIHCGAAFTPKRKEQALCSVTCRQAHNGKCRRGQKTGPSKSEYKRRLTKDGYYRVYCAHHPFADGRKEMHEHDLVMERKIGRRLMPTECVHHRNGIKTDNRMENLEVMSHSEHSSLHNKELVRQRRRDANGRLA